jgi:hypothetical protein
MFGGTGHAGEKKLLIGSLRLPAIDFEPPGRQLEKLFHQSLDKAKFSNIIIIANKNHLLLLLLPPRWQEI